ncbi:hypothetical protein FRC06_009329, partial [Ceratobasidium sp. 370]
MYAAGLQRQGFEVLAHIGLLISYSLLVSGLGTQVSRRRHRHRHTGSQTSQRKRTPAFGPLKTLATECIQEVKGIVNEGKPIGFVFDNVNFMFKVAEPVLGKIDEQSNGTCATAFELHGATDEALDQASAHAAFLTAGPLELQDIILSPKEQTLHRQLMIYTILRLVIYNGGKRFAHYMPILEATQPSTNHLIELHQSLTHPLPAMEIDESSVDGAITVMNNLYAAVGMNTSDKAFKCRIQFVAGDYKSISNLRTGKESRAGHEDPEYSFGNLTLLSTLDASQTQNAASKGTDQKTPPSWEQLLADATKIYEKYANIRTVEELRQARRLAEPGQTVGDMVYEDALLFMRDMLNLQEIHSAVKRGDSGRILLILKIFALSFRGAGRSHYAQEILSVIHHVQKVWPAPLR